MSRLARFRKFSCVEGDGGLLRLDGVHILRVLAHYNIYQRNNYREEFPSPIKLGRR